MNLIITNFELKLANNNINLNFLNQLLFRTT